ncbi:MAG: LptE family protein [Pelovirga sp.]
MIRAVLLLLLVALTGCGYHFAGQSGTLPGGVTRIQVPLFANLSGEPQLEARLTDHLVARFSRSRNMKLVAPEAAEAVLVGTIRSYRSASLSYVAGDQISQYRATMVVDVLLQRVDSGEELWRRTVQWSTDYAASADKTQQWGQEQLAQDELSQRLAAEIHSLLFDDF